MAVFVWCAWCVMLFDTPTARECIKVTGLVVQTAVPGFPPHMDIPCRPPHHDAACAASQRALQQQEARLYY